MRARLKEFLRLASRFCGVAADLGLAAALIRLSDWTVMRLARQPRLAGDGTLAAAAASRRALSPQAPTIAVIVPVFDTPAIYLQACIESVLSQTYARWELCICDDGSTSRATIAVLDQYRGTDPRIRIVRAPGRLNIAAASNLAAEQASGTFLAFLDHDDCLHPEALEALAAASEQWDDADLIYTDEDKIELNGVHSEPYCKPDWSPEHLRSVMYVLHCLCLRKSLFWEMGGLRSDYDGAQDYDLALRASALARRIVHIPRILYHWRKVEGSAAAKLDAKPYALEAGRRALRAALHDQGHPASVLPGLLPGTFRVRHEIKGSPPVTLVILTGLARRRLEGRGEVLLVENFIRSIVATTRYPNYSLLVVHDGEFPADLSGLVTAAGGRLAAYGAPGAFNFARKANFAFGLVETNHLILLNDDLEVITPDWIESLLEYSQQPDIGAVGARLLFPDGRLQHAGIVCGLTGEAGHVFYGMPANAVGYNGFSHLVRNYSAVTAAALATRRDVLARVGLFDEGLPIDFNDVDFCLRAWQAGLRVVYTPYAALYHYERSSIQRNQPMNAGLFREKWQTVIDRDPFYNPALSRTDADCGYGYGPLPQQSYREVRHEAPLMPPALADYIALPGAT